MYYMYVPTLILLKYICFYSAFFLAAPFMAPIPVVAREQR